MKPIRRLEFLAAGLLFVTLVSSPGLPGQAKPTPPASGSLLPAPSTDGRDNGSHRHVHESSAGDLGAVRTDVLDAGAGPPLMCAIATSWCDCRRKLPQTFVRNTSLVSDF